MSAKDLPLVSGTKKNTNNTPKKQNAENIQNVCPFPKVSFMAVNVDVIKNASDQLKVPAAEAAIPLISFENNSPIIIHGIGPKKEERKKR